MIPHGLFLVGALLTASPTSETQPPLPDAPLVKADLPVAPRAEAPVSLAPAAVLAETHTFEGDPFRGTFRGGEVGAASAGVFLGDLMSIAIGLGGGFALCDSSCTSSDAAPLGLIAAVAAVGVAADILLTPIFAAAFAHWWSAPDSAGSMAKSLLLAYGAKVLELVSLVAALALAPLAIVLGPLALAIHCVGVPLAASYGLHWSSTDAGSAGVQVASW